MKYLIICAAFLFTSIGYSQGGIKVGANFANQRTNIDFFGGSERNSGVKVGLNLGAFAYLPFTDFLKLETGIGLSQKGFTNTYNNLLGEEVTQVGTLNYLEVPAHLLISVGKESRLNVSFGPTIGFLLNGNVKFRDDNGDKVTYNIGNDDDDDVQRLDYGATLGLGIQTSSGIILQFTTTGGIKNILPNGDDDDDIRRTNNHIAFTIGKMF